MSQNIITIWSMGLATPHSDSLWLVYSWPQLYHMQDDVVVGIAPKTRIRQLDEKHMKALG